MSGHMLPSKTKVICESRFQALTIWLYYQIEGIVFRLGRWCSEYLLWYLPLLQRTGNNHSKSSLSLRILFTTIEEAKQIWEVIVRCRAADTRRSAAYMTKQRLLILPTFLNMGCSSVISHFSQESLFYLLKLRKFNVEYTFVILSQIIQKYKSIHLLLLDNLRQKYKSIHLYLCYFWIFRRKILQIYIQKYEYTKVLKCQTQALIQKYISIHLYFCYFWIFREKSSKYPKVQISKSTKV